MERRGFYVMKRMEFEVVERMVGQALHIVAADEHVGRNAMIVVSNHL